MKLIVGLGNPEKRFRNTRHNTGFLVVEELAGILNDSGSGRWGVDRRVESEVSRLSTINYQLFLAKPCASMNSSGKVVGNLVRWLKVGLDDLLLVHDDLDLSLGDFRLQKGRGAAGHKGVKSAIDALGSKDFWRLRVGIGRPPEGIAVENYVLESFSRAELKMLEDLIEGGLVSVVRRWLSKS